MGRNTNALMEFLESAIATAGSGTTVSIPINIPTVPDESLVCMIWKVDFLGISAVPVSAVGYVEFALGRREDEATPDFPGVICAGRVDTAAQDAVARPGVFMVQGTQHYFDPPVAIARPTLYVVVACVASLTSGTAYCKVGYTIEKVPQNVLLRALLE